MPRPDDLTQPQWEAVDHFEGPLLVLAGPGSGKTRVITRRIARLIERGVSPSEILAITFTNKAATEMADRVAKLLAGARVWVTTFHKMCARLIRRHAAAVGLRPNFTILDTTDQRTVLKHVLEDLASDAARFAPGQIAGRISLLKNRLQAPPSDAEEGPASGDLFDITVARAYARYQQALLASNAVDFDDLLLHAAVILREHPEIRRQWDQMFRFVLVDEYQDTNLAQYQIVRSLSVDFPNLCATGDPDQSIYGWRGADIENILRFERDFPRARVVRLEQNFRSTQSILQVADRLIARNVKRKVKQLLTDNPVGVPVAVDLYDDSDAEARGIAEGIRQALAEGHRKPSEFAVLYRINALSRRLEVALTHARIPYQVAAGFAFFERAEVKDLLGYLRLIHNPADEPAFRRVVNTPVRGIGKQTQTRLLQWAAQQRITVVEAAQQAQRIPGLSRRAAVAAERFAAMLQHLSLAGAGSVQQLLKEVLDRTRYAEAWESSHAEEDVQRLANVNELLNAAHQYDEAADGEPTLEGFLESCSLVSDIDACDADAGKVTLMTLHAAKGLEFPVVVIVGLEQNLLPHQRALAQDDARGLEEERRLLFVGLTRAQQELRLTLSRLREDRGQVNLTIPSCFLQEMGVNPAAAGSAPLRGADDPRVADVRPSPPVVQASRESVAEALRGVLGVDPAAAEQAARSLVNERGQPLLRTGASLLSAREDAATPVFQVGMRVRHPREGVGTVVDVGQGGSRRTVTVEFANGERAVFVQQKCPLQPLGVG